MTGPPDDRTEPRYCARCGYPRADVRPAPDLEGEPAICDACWSHTRPPAPPREKRRP